MARMSAAEERDVREWLVAHRDQIMRRFTGGETVRELSARYGISRDVLARMVDRWLYGLPDEEWEA